MGVENGGFKPLVSWEGQKPTFLVAVSFGLLFIVQAAECSTQSNNANIEALILEKDRLVQEKKQLVQDTKQLVQEKDQLVQEKDQLVQDKTQLVQEKDQLVKENKEQTANNTNLVNDNTRLGQMVTELQNQIQSERNIPCCPSGWQSHESTCYQLSSRENTWQHAKEDCENKGSHLLILYDEAEEKVVRGFGGDAKLWMGLSGNLNRQKNKWELKTVDSSPWCYTNWKEPTLNVGSNISCAYVDYHTLSLKTWTLVRCQEQHKWMCEKKPASICQQNIPCCPSGWQSHESTCYQLSSSENTWQHAKEDCESKGSHLVVSNDEAEEKVVRGFGGDAKLWMGLSGNLNSETNRWYLTTVDSISLCYGNWKEPTPKVASNIYCAYVDYHTSSLKNWFRVSCEEQHKWMCEMKRASIFRI
ncbi:C-type lectin domain family 10 member A-like isoform X3 [Trematomus bernacchii]|uniref:C-type lectin domain family 10 member A-like isoform X3 n=1 Tax=Trematomus bernacchii TaxID=40690 RepID=UPI00146A379B|nr:C-type lectin domain family 10 member A-like isoform X3 [Trematomus bernacchii]